MSSRQSEDGSGRRSRRRRDSRSRSNERSRSRSRGSRDRTKKKKNSKWDMPAAEDSVLGFGGVVIPALQAPVEDRRGRRLYVGNLPAGVSEQAIVQFFNGALLAAAGVEYSVAAASGQFPVLKAEIGPRRTDASGQADHRYCFLEFRTIADANICLKLDGISFNGFTLKVGRPNDYTSVPAASEISTAEALAAVARGVPKLAQLVQETKMYARDLPLTLTDDALRQMSVKFGPVRSAAIMKDLRTGQSMGCGVVEFENPSHVDEAVAVKAARQQGATPSPVVQLLNCVFPEDLVKDDEYQQILKDVREEAQQFGTLTDVIIPRPDPDLTHKEGVGKIFIHFSDLTSARRAQAELNGRKYEGRRVICAAFFPLEKFLEGRYTLM